MQVLPITMGKPTYTARTSFTPTRNVRFGIVLSGLDGADSWTPTIDTNNDVLKQIGKVLHDYTDKSFHASEIQPLMENLQRLSKTNPELTQSLRAFLSTYKEIRSTSYYEGIDNGVTRWYQDYNEKIRYRDLSNRGDEQVAKRLKNLRKFYEQVNQFKSALAQIPDLDYRRGVFQQLVLTEQQWFPNKLHLATLNEIRIQHPESKEMLKRTLWRMIKSGCEKDSPNTGNVLRAVYHLENLCSGQYTQEAHQQFVQEDSPEIQDMCNTLLTAPWKWVIVHAIPLLQHFDDLPFMDPDRGDVIEASLRMQNDPDIIQALDDWKKGHPRQVFYTHVPNEPTQSSGTNLAPAQTTKGRGFFRRWFPWLGAPRDKSQLLALEYKPDKNRP